MIDPDCPLCRAERITEWYLDADECWITDCMVCMTPMIVWRSHGLPDAETETSLLARLEPFARERYPDGYYVDGERRRIPDHWHAHARPVGGFFDPRSDLYERYP
jgi:hypothetical protein